MLATSLLSLLLLALAGVLLDSHRRDWTLAGRNSPTSREGRFARSRLRRRLIGTLSIAFVGALVALWPAIPRVPLWVLGYAATLAALAMQIFVLGVWDAWASSRFYQETSSQRMAEHALALREALEEAKQGSPDPTVEAEAIRA